MATIIPNAFTSYELTDEEQLQGQILSQQQLQVFQNERARLAEEKLLLAIDPNDVLASAQAEAHKIGQLELITWIIECSEVANTELNNPETT